MSEWEQESQEMPGSAEQEPVTQAVAPRPHLGLTREEMNWAALAHASVLVTFLIGIATGGFGALIGVLIPAIIWYAYREKSDYVTQQAKQATIYQLAGVVGWYVLVLGGAIVLAAGAVIGAILTLVLVGLILLLAVALLVILWGAAVVVLPIAQVVYGCYAAVETYNGRPFRYWWLADMIERYEAQH